MTKHRQAAGAALHAEKSSGSTALEFLVTVAFLSAGEGRAAEA